MSQNLESHSGNISNASIVDAGRPWAEHTIRYLNKTTQPLTPNFQSASTTFTVTLNQDYYQPNDVIVNSSGQRFYPTIDPTLLSYPIKSKSEEVEYNFFDLITLKRD
jgi:hypothetical protein